MNLDRIYEHRFRNVTPESRQVVWNEIAQYMHERLGRPQVLLDPAAGLCEYINHAPSPERWAQDMNRAFLEKHAAKGVQLVVGDALKADLPAGHFDGVFVSNFLEHLNSQYEVADFLGKMHGHIKPGGRIAIMGPNFKYVFKNYFDFADHTVVLTEEAVVEHLIGAGFTVEHVHSRFLPFSFKGRLPVSRWLVRTFLRTPLAWRFLGKQFLLIARK